MVLNINVKNNNIYNFKVDSFYFVCCLSKVFYEICNKSFESFIYFKYKVAYSGHKKIYFISG